MKRISMLLMALLLSASALASCSGDTQTSDDTTAADTTTAAQTEEVVQFVADDLPELDYKGASVNWFCGDYSEAYYIDLYYDEETGNAVNDSLYRARRSVEERTNTTLGINQFTFTWATRDEYLSYIQSLVLSGDTTYDAIVGYTAGSLVIEGGYFNDIAESKYINPDKPWWNKAIQEIMPDDTLYFLSGDASMTLIKHCLCVYFNQDLMNTLGIDENLYEMVESGTWTFDTLEALISDTYTDLNGNQEADENDRYGLTFGDNNKYRMLPAATQVVFSEKTSDGYEFSLINERSNDVFTRLQTLVMNNTNVRGAKGNTDANTDSFASFGGNYASTIFASGRALLSASLVGDASYILSNSDFTLGMVPYPKFNEQQDDYYTAPQRNSMIYIPSSVVGEQFDRAGAILEAWSSECYRSVMPTYFETNLKVRYSTDNDMAAMFDLLRDNMVINLDYAFSSNLSLNVDLFKSIDKEGFSFTSETEAKREASEIALDELVDALRG